MFIDYKKQPTNMSCGQTCVAMIMWKTVEEISAVMGKGGGTYTKDLVKAFRHFEVNVSSKLIRKSKGCPLPPLCIVKLKHPAITKTHWSVYHDGVFYDPSIGMLERYPEVVKIVSYLEIYEEPPIHYEEQSSPLPAYKNQIK